MSTDLTLILAEYDPLMVNGMFDDPGHIPNGGMWRTCKFPISEPNLVHVLARISHKRSAASP